MDTVRSWIRVRKSEALLAMSYYLALGLAVCCLDAAARTRGFIYDGEKKVIEIVSSVCEEEILRIPFIRPYPGSIGLSVCRGEHEIASHIVCVPS
jgi:hypothetical protein